MQLDDDFAIIWRHCRKEYGLPDKVLTSKRRGYDYVLCRHVFFYACRKLTDRPYVQIGRAAGGRDHSTVLHGFRRIDDEIELYPRLKKEVERVLHGAKLDIDRGIVSEDETRVYYPQCLGFLTGG